MPTSDHDLPEPASPAEPHADWDDADETGEEDIPSAVLYIIAALLVLAFALYIAVGGGHNHFH